MTKRVLDVGNCGPDFVAIRRFLTSEFDCEVDQADSLDDSLIALRRADYALVLINRKLDRDYSDGVDVLKALKADDQFRRVPVMLVTNYADHQDAAVELGAERGFGKLALGKWDTVQKLAPYLPLRTQ